MLKPWMKPDSDYNDKRGPSPALWKLFPVREVGGGLFDINEAFLLYDDFDVAVIPASTGGAMYTDKMPYTTYYDTTGTVTISNSTLVLTPHTDDNDAASVGPTAANTIPFSVTHDVGRDLVFECRFKVSSITATTQDFFIGLGGAGCVANDGGILDDSGGLASNNFLGFGRQGAYTTEMFLHFQRASGTYSGIGYELNGVTLAASTWVKAGFYFNAAANSLKVFVNGTEVQTVTAADVAAPVSHDVTAATPWPSLNMGFFAESKVQATGGVLTVDWWAGAQVKTAT